MTKDFRINRRQALAGLGAAGGLAALGGLRPAFASEFPSRTINWLVYQAPGGSHDVTTRIIEPKLSAELNVPIAVENLTGAGGRIARARVYNARPDGYTIITDNSNNVVLGELFFDGAYVSEEFEPIFGWERTGYQICVEKDSDIRTFEDLYNAAQNRRVTVATIGHGSDAHLQMLLIEEQLGMPLQLVHFDGSSRAYTALLGGHVDAAIAGAGSGVRMEESLHFLGVTNPDGDIALPDVPTLQAQGFDVEPLLRIWYAYTSPGVAEDRVQRLAAAFETVFEDEELVAQQHAAGISAIPIHRDEIKRAIAAFKQRAIQFQDVLTQ